MLNNRPLRGFYVGLGDNELDKFVFIRRQLAVQDLQSKSVLVMSLATVSVLGVEGLCWLCLGTGLG